MHTVPVRPLVQLPVDFNGGQEGILGIERRSLVFQRMQTSHLSCIEAIRYFILELFQAILSYTDVLAGGLDAEMVAYSWPELVFPRNKVVLNAK